MFGSTHDIDNSFPVGSRDEEVITRDVASLEIDLQNLREENDALNRLSLRPHVLKYETDLKELRMKMRLSSAVPGEVSKRNVQLWDDEISTLDKFITELLSLAHEVL